MPSRDVVDFRYVGLSLCRHNEQATFTGCAMTFPPGRRLWGEAVYDGSKVIAKGLLVSVHDTRLLLAGGG